MNGDANAPPGGTRGRASVQAAGELSGAPVRPTAVVSGGSSSYLTAEPGLSSSEV